MGQRVAVLSSNLSTSPGGPPFARHIQQPIAAVPIAAELDVRSQVGGVELTFSFIMGQSARLPDRAYVSRLLAMATARIIRADRYRRVVPASLGWRDGSPWQR